jgi:hypothetical protein
LYQRSLPSFPFYLPGLSESGGVDDGEFHSLFAAFLQRRQNNSRRQEKNRQVDLSRDFLQGRVSPASIDGIRLGVDGEYLPGISLVEKPLEKNPSRLKAAGDPHQSNGSRVEKEVQVPSAIQAALLSAEKKLPPKEEKWKKRLPPLLFKNNKSPFFKQLNFLFFLSGDGKTQNP